MWQQATVLARLCASRDKSQVLDQTANESVNRRLDRGQGDTTAESQVEAGGGTTRPRGVGYGTDELALLELRPW